MKILRRATENDAVVTAYDPPRSAALKGQSASAPFEATLAFEPVDGGTRPGRNDLPVERADALIGPLFIGRYERGWERGLVNLKRMVESGEL